MDKETLIKEHFALMADLLKRAKESTDTKQVLNLTGSIANLSESISDLND